VTPEFVLRIARNDDPVIGFLKHKKFPSALFEIHHGASTPGASSPKVGFYLLKKISSTSSLRQINIWCGNNTATVMCQILLALRYTLANNLLKLISLAL
jgi:hypothetical protein